MANTYKNILIVPNIGAATGTDPYISFRGGNATVNTEITLKVYPDSNGTLSFEGNTGQLFSITNDLTGSIFSVNDISGIPSIDVNANGEVRLAQFDGNVMIGNTTSDGISLLSVNGPTKANSYSTLQSAPTISANTLTLNLSNSTVFQVSLNSNITTLTLSNVRTSGSTSSFILVFVADGTARSVTWPASFRWPGNTAPTLTSANTKRDVFTIFTHDGGTNWHAFISGQNL